MPPTAPTIERPPAREAAVPIERGAVRCPPRLLSRRQPPTALPRRPEPARPKLAPLAQEAIRFVLMSFEGPDAYSRAGGLGSRVTDLARSLAERGHTTDLIYIGDPDLPAVDSEVDGRLTWRRWSQWISKYHPLGVYDGEEGKLADYRASVPAFVADEIVAPAVARGQRVCVLAEDWHTAEPLCLLSDALYSRGLREQAVLLWNANNSFGFEKIDWGRLQMCSTLTAVSRWMKHEMWTLGLNPLVIPNGVADWWLEPPDQTKVASIRRSAQGRTLLVKIARFDPDKRWLTAIHTVAELKRTGTPVRLVMRGGMEAHGGEVMHLAECLGLQVHHAEVNGEGDATLLAALHQAGDADILVYDQQLPQSFLHCLYAAADGVLANSGREPFGLVGLEAMASGGVAFTGCTGEDYCVTGDNGIALDTDDPREIAYHLRQFRAQPELARRLRQRAQARARDWTWDHAIRRLKSCLPLAAALQCAWGEDPLGG